MDIFCRKRESPIMYPKLCIKPDGGRTVNKPPSQILTEFYDTKDNLISPTDLMNRRMKVILAIKVIGIHTNAEATPSIQLNVNDAIVLEMADRPRRLLA